MIRSGACSLPVPIGEDGDGSRVDRRRMAPPERGGEGHVLMKLLDLMDAVAACYCRIAEPALEGWCEHLLFLIQGPNAEGTQNQSLDAISANGRVLHITTGTADRDVPLWKEQRILLMVPTLLCLSWGYSVVSSLLVLIFVILGMSTTNQRAILSPIVRMMRSSTSSSSSLLVTFATLLSLQQQALGDKDKATAHSSQSEATTEMSASLSISSTTHGITLNLLDEDYHSQSPRSSTRRSKESIGVESVVMDSLIGSDSFEVVTTGSPVLLPSNMTEYRQVHIPLWITGPIYHAIFSVACWISLLHYVPRTRYAHWLQYVVLMGLSGLEMAHVIHATTQVAMSDKLDGVSQVKTPATRSEPTASTDATSATDATRSLASVSGTASLGDRKRVDIFLPMLQLGATALYMFPLSRYLGLFFFMLLVPMSYHSWRCKMKPRVIYVIYPASYCSSNKNNNTFNSIKAACISESVPSVDAATLLYWMRSKQLGNKLIVGVPVATVVNGGKVSSLARCVRSEPNQQLQSTTCQHVQLAQVVPFVDHVIAGAPLKADLMFLERQGIDLVVLPPFLSSGTVLVSPTNTPPSSTLSSSSTSVFGKMSIMTSASSSPPPPTTTTILPSSSWSSSSNSCKPQTLLVTDEVVAAGRCWMIRETGLARLVTGKGEHMD